MPPLRLLVLGAHPDDAEFRAGGLGALYRSLGHVVKFVSLTNGDAGHQTMFGPELAARRRAEAAAAGRVIGAAYETWDHHDGLLQPTLEVRFQVIREIRTFKPDLVLTHRTNDYHPDHRACGNVVRDACFMMTVPAIVPEVPILREEPVVAYLYDDFTKPAPLQPDVVIDITGQLDAILAMLACHESQMFEWLPYNERVLDRVPTDPEGRKHWVRDFYLGRTAHMADRCRQRLIETYGPGRGGAIQHVEVFEISEYASPLTPEARRRLFPFLPQ
ncbi:MAG: PIG-L deacetylase family protein [Verrucomicrobiota bacterium]